MFNFIKKLGNKIKNIFKRPNYKKLYEEAIKQQNKISEEVSQLTEKVKSLEKINEDNQAKIDEYNSWKKSMNFVEDVKGQNTIQGIRLDLLEKLFNRGEVQLGKYSKKKANRYLTTNPDFLDKWYEVIEKDKEGVEPKYDISSQLKVINKELIYHLYL